MQTAEEPHDCKTEIAHENFKNTMHCRESDNTCGSIQCTPTRITSKVQKSILKSTCKTKLHPFPRRQKRDRKPLPDLDGYEEFRNIIDKTQSSATDNLKPTFNINWFNHQNHSQNTNLITCPIKRR